MAAELEQELGAKVTLVASGGGVFEVSLGDRLIFSKNSTGRFPEDGEVLGLVRSA